MQGIKHTTRRLSETSLSGGVKCTHGICVATLLYKYELNIVNIALFYPIQSIEHTTRRPIETSLSGGVNCTRGSCVAIVFYKDELIIINKFSLPNERSETYNQTTD